MKYKLLQIYTDSVAHHLSARAINWAETVGPKLLISIVVFFAGEWTIKLIKKGLNKILSVKKIDATLLPFIQNLMSITLQVLLVLLIMSILGIKMTLFAAVIGAFGVAIGLALSGTLQNFASGILIILMQPFRVGENIQTQGEKGTVMAIKLFYTVVRTFNNITLIVPNGKLSNEVIFNLTREKNTRLDISLKLPYTIDFKVIHSMLSEAVASFPSILTEPPVRIGIEKIEADGYTFVIGAWVPAHGYEDVKLAFSEKMMDTLRPIIHPA